MNIYKGFRWLIRWENKHRLIPHLVVFCILTFLAAKVVFRSNTANGIFFFYGLLVTTTILTTFTIAFTRYKDPSIKARQKELKGEDPFVSCLVAAYNEETIIERCVASLANQTYRNKEIIFVDDCSTDRTGAILDELAKQYPIQVIHLPANIGKKGALTRAVGLARGTIYAFSDSDSVWAPDAVERIVPIFQAYPKVGAVSGHTRALNANTNLLTKVQDSWYEGQYSIRKAFESVFGSITCVSGPLAVFRKDAIYNFMPAWEHDTFLGQPFRFATDRTLTGYVLGSKYIGKRLKRNCSDPHFLVPDYPLREWKIVYCKSARAWTQVPDTFSRVIKQQVRWKKSFIRNIFFTGTFYWRKPFLPAMVYYLHIAFVLVGPLIAFRHMIYLPLHGNLYSMFLYLAGISFIGFMFGLALKLEDPETRRWIYRPLMSLLSTLVLSWLIFYSALTIRKMAWHRT
jgi:cellulose synthase/poly-beta-1,6-N-acetylglucosamine synthase-like glycosyltransferase